jgi:lysophospholipase L1-like esterase
MTSRMAGFVRGVRIRTSFALLAAVVGAAPLGAQGSATDWGNLARYRAANAELGAPAAGEKRVVFMGNSITDSWAKWFPQMFPGKPYVGRGISGQTTPQMLVRFRQDVIALQPAVVLILAGTNDIAGNTGPSTLEMIEDNLASMTQLAKANGIRVVLASVLPVYDYPWRKGLDPAPKIVALNAWIKAYAERSGAVYLDFHTAMKDDRQGLRADLTSDGVHPTEAGYRVMAPLVEQAIAQALRNTQRGDAEHTYDNAVVDDAGRALVMEADGQAISIPRDSDQVGFDRPAVSADHRSVGWLALYPNCCTTYPIPLELVVIANGTRRSFHGALPVWKWTFSADGTQIAFMEGTVHGGGGEHYELRDVLSGRVVSTYDPEPDKPQAPPAWVQRLTSAP